MTQEKLQKIIEELEVEVAKDKATFGIFQYGGGSDESFIKADKGGLMLFALEILKAANKYDITLNDKNKNIIPIKFKESWFSDQSDTVVQYIEPVNERLPNEKPVNHKDTIFDKLLPFGCYAVLIFLVATLLVGLWTLVKWIF